MGDFSEGSVFGAEKDIPCRAQLTTRVKMVVAVVWAESFPLPVTVTAYVPEVVPRSASGTDFRPCHHRRQYILLE
jgi:hypothetical protein